MVWGWFKHIMVIVHFISIIISTSPQIIRHQILELGDPCSRNNLGSRSSPCTGSASPHGFPLGGTFHYSFCVVWITSSIQFIRSIMSNSLWPHGLQHARLTCPSPTPRAYSNARPLSRWCHPTSSSSVVPFSSCLQSFPASGSFPMNQFFASGGHSIGVSASASVLQVNIQDWFPLGWTGWISLQSKGLSRVFSNTTVQKHQFFGAQLSF